MFGRKVKYKIEVTLTIFKPTTTYFQANTQPFSETNEQLTYTMRAYSFDFNPTNS